MSVLIKGMEMPSECEYCGFYRFYPENGNIWCNAKNRILKTKWEEPYWTHLDMKRPDWCPLIELPEKHGRLIDGDALVTEMTNGIRAGNLEDGYEKYQNINNMDDCVECVKYADVVIEAEGE